MKRRRRGLTDPGLSWLDSIDLSPLCDVDFTQGQPYAHRIVNPGVTQTRASSGLEYWLQPAVLRGNNVARYGTFCLERYLGLLIENADTNVIIRNIYPDYLTGDWTKAGITDTEVVTPDIYNGGSISLVAGGVNGQWTQAKVLTAAGWIACIVVYTDGSAVTSADMQIVMGISPAVTTRATTFEHLGNGFYLAWAVQTATAVAWEIGLEVKANKTVYASLLSCYLSGAPGVFPRSPIPNTTAANITRAKDVCTIAMANNVGALEGTVKAMFIAPAAESQVANDNRIVDLYKGANDRISITYFAAGNKLRVYLKMGGVAILDLNGALGCSRGDLIKIHLAYRQPTTLDGTNYAIFWADDGTGWVQLAQSAVQPTGALDTTGTIHIGESSAGTLQLCGFFCRLQTYNRAILDPGW